MATGVKCPAGHTRVWKKGTTPSLSGPKTRYICYVCGKTFYSEPPKAKPVGKPVVLKGTKAKKPRSTKKK